MLVSFHFNPQFISLTAERIYFREMIQIVLQKYVVSHTLCMKHNESISCSACREQNKQKRRIDSKTIDHGD